MKKLLVTLTLLASSLTQAVTLTHFTIHRDGGGEIEANVTESDEGLRINVVKCQYRTMPAGTEVEVRGKEFILQTKMILNGQASIYSDQSPWLQMAELGTWTRLVYYMDVHQNHRRTNPNLPARIERIEVSNPKITIDGKESNILEVLEKQANALCK